MQILNSYGKILGNVVSCNGLCQESVKSSLPYPLEVKVTEKGKHHHGKSQQLLMGYKYADAPGIDLESGSWTLPWPWTSAGGNYSFACTAPQKVDQTCKLTATLPWPVKDETDMSVAITGPQGDQWGSKDFTNVTGSSDKNSWLDAIFSKLPLAVLVRMDNNHNIQYLYGGKGGQLNYDQNPTGSNISAEAEFDGWYNSTDMPWLGPDATAPA